MHHFTLYYLSLLCCGLSLAGCSSGGGDPAPLANTDTAAQPAPSATPSATTPTPSTAVSPKIVALDATAGGFGAKPEDPKNKFTYLSLATGTVVPLSDAEAAISTAWDLAFKRTSIKLNGGVSGPGTVKGAVADAQAKFYEADGVTPNTSVFLNATAAQELAALEAVTADSGLTYQSDRDVPNIKSDGSSTSWWAYNAQTHTVSANPNNWYIVRGAAGDSYAKLNVTEIAQADRAVTLTLHIQAPGETGFATTATSWKATLGASGGTACYDFETRAKVDCTANAATWDLQLEISTNGRSWNLWTNSGVKGSGGKGGSFGAIDPASIGSYASNGAVPNFFTDTRSGIFTDKSWYAYNLQGRNLLWPNYRVYLVDTGNRKYKLQILSYYNEAGGSGHYRVRYLPLP
ncbi:MAG: HmuY family protein [Thiotrichales bacterium]